MGTYSDLVINKPTIFLGEVKIATVLEQHFLPLNHICQKDIYANKTPVDYKLYKYRDLFCLVCYCIPRIQYIPWHIKKHSVE